MARSMASRLFTQAVQALDWSVGWHRLPPALGVLSLIGMRVQLRERNLHDASAETSVDGQAPYPMVDGWAPKTPASCCAAAGAAPRYLTARTADGSYNDLEHPAMGSAGTRFGRNVRLARTHPEAEPALLTPSPRVVSQELLTRRAFLPATTLNLLAAAWLQFMVRDWFNHGRTEEENPWELPLSADDPWHERPMRIERTRRDPSYTCMAGAAAAAPTYVNTETHWWDGSQIYGSSAAAQARVRSGKGGKLIIGPDGIVSVDAQALFQATGLADWWLGLALLHTLFTLEHNAICDRLRAAYPSWSDDDLFDHARLVNAALMAKIHTVEWTTAILGHPTLHIAMRANWWGLATERIHRLVGRVSDSEVVSGIPGSHKTHYGVPYAMTEEFVAVYRMHPLLPDDFCFRSVVDDALVQERALADIAAKRTPEIFAHVSMTDLLYSFGTAHPGAITLHNYPRYLQRFERPDGHVMDLGATDILRAREVGVPRYNEFRRLVHRPPVKTFAELTDNPIWADELRRVYDGDIDRVDLMVGLFAERPPRGFGFSDTAFRIFILMASRRLNSDRFFTTDYTPRVYTQVGLDWIGANDMSSVLARHFPALQPALRHVKNPFAPWGRASS